jgi:glycosyltransferase involved in cell wall biosynthesis
VKVSVLINNYNYEKFLVECVNSVLNQTYHDVEVIFVDDGSTDKSLDVINSLNDKRIKVISKENGGQLSAFNVGIKNASGEILFFLDSDDAYKPNYLEDAINFYNSNKDCDFLYVARELIGTEEGVSSSGKTRSNGYTYFTTLYGRKWVGSVTSSVSVKRDFLLKLFPLESIESDWITRADDCLVWGTSLFGAKKYYLDNPYVLYRVHGSNNFFGKKFDEKYCYIREINIVKLFNLLLIKSGFNESPNLFLIEFFSSKKTPPRTIEYLKILFKTNFSLFNKLVIVVKMVFKSNIDFKRC